MPKPTLAELSAEIEACAARLRNAKSLAQAHDYELDLRDAQALRDMLYPHWAGTLDDQMAPSWEYTPC